MATYDELFPNADPRLREPFEPIKPRDLGAPSGAQLGARVRKAIPTGETSLNTADKLDSDLAELMAGFKPTAPVEKTSALGDLGHAFTAGVGSTGSMLAGVGEYGARQAGAEGVADALGGARRAASDFAQRQIAKMSPEAQDRMARQWLTLDPDKTIWKGNPLDFVSSLALKVSQAAPSSLLTLIPGGIMMRAGLGAGGVAYLGASEGVLSMGSIAANLADEIEQAPEQELMQSERYQQLRGTMDEAAARSQLITEAQGAAPLVGGTIVGVISALGGKYLQPKITEGAGLGKLFASGFKEEAVQESSQSAAEQIAQNVAAEIYDKGRSTFEGVGEQAVEGGIVGGLTGGIVTAGVGRGRRTAIPPPGEQPTGEEPPVDPDIVAALRASDAYSRTEARFEEQARTAPQYDPYTGQQEMFGTPPTEDFDTASNAAPPGMRGAGGTPPLMHDVAGGVTRAQAIENARNPPYTRQGDWLNDRAAPVVTQELNPQLPLGLREQRRRGYAPSVITPMPASPLQEEQLGASEYAPPYSSADVKALTPGEPITDRRYSLYPDINQQDLFAPPEPAQAAPEPAAGGGGATRQSQGFALRVRNEQGQLVGEDLFPSAEEANAAADELYKRDPSAFISVEPEYTTTPGQRRSATPAEEGGGQEPLSYIMAQLDEMQDPDALRKGVYLSPSTIAGLRAQGVFERVRGTGVPLNNFKTQGDVLIARDQATANELQQAREQGVDLQEIVGRATGSGTGKPEGGEIVVQQRTPEGSVVRQSVVATQEEAEQLAAAWDAPERETFILSAAAALRRQNQLVRKESQQLQAEREQKGLRRAVSDKTTAALGDTREQFAVERLAMRGGSPAAAAGVVTTIAARKERVRQRRKIDGLDRPADLDFGTADLNRRYAELFDKYVTAATRLALAESTPEGSNVANVARSANIIRARASAVKARDAVLAFRKLHEAKTKAEKLAGVARELSPTETRRIARNTKKKEGDATVGDLSAFEPLTSAEVEALTDEEVDTEFVRAASWASGRRAKRKRDKQDGRRDDSIGTRKSGETFAATKQEGETRTLYVKKRVAPLEPRPGLVEEPPTKSQEVGEFESADASLEQILSDERYRTPSERRKYVGRIHRRARVAQHPGGKLKKLTFGARALKVIDDFSATGKAVKGATVKAIKSLSLNPSLLMHGELTESELEASADDRAALKERGDRAFAALDEVLPVARVKLNALGRTTAIEGVSSTDMLLGRAYLRVLYEYARALGGLKKTLQRNYGVARPQTAAAIAEVEALAGLFKKLDPKSMPDVLAEMSKLMQAESRELLLLSTKSDTKVLGALKDKKTRLAATKLTLTQINKRLARAKLMEEEWRNDPYYQNGVAPMIRKLANEIYQGARGRGAAENKPTLQDMQTLKFSVRMIMNRVGRKSAAYRALVRSLQDLGVQIDKKTRQVVIPTDMGKFVWANPRLLEVLYQRRFQERVRDTRGSLPGVMSEPTLPAPVLDYAQHQHEIRALMQANPEFTEAQAIEFIQESRRAKHVAAVNEVAAAAFRRRHEAAMEGMGADQRRVYMTLLDLDPNQFARDSEVTGTEEPSSKVTATERNVAKVEAYNAAARVLERDLRGATRNDIIAAEARFLDLLKRLNLAEPTGNSLFWRIKQPTPHTVRTVGPRLRRDVMTNTQAVAMMRELYAQLPAPSGTTEEVYRAARSTVARSFREVASRQTRSYKKEERARELSMTPEQRRVNKAYADRDRARKSLDLIDEGGTPEGYAKGGEVAMAMLDANGEVQLNDLLMEVFRELPSGSLLAQVAQKVLDLNMNVGVFWNSDAHTMPEASRVVARGRNKGRFHFGDGAQFITLNKAFFSDMRRMGTNPSAALAHTLLHEAVHAATLGALRSNSAVRASLESLRSLAVIEAKRLGQPLRHGHQSVEEFVAEAFSNPEFQNNLREVQVPRQESIWTRLKNVILRAIGIEPKVEFTNALDAILETTDKVFTGTDLSNYAAESAPLDDAVAGRVGEFVGHLKQSADVRRAVEGRALEAGDTANAALLSALTMEQINDFHGKKLRMVGDDGRERFPIYSYWKAFSERNADNSANMREADPISKEWTRLTEELGTAKTVELSRVMTKATEWRVHPDLDISDKLNQHITGPETRKVHAELARRFSAMDPRLQKLYRTVREYYAKSRETEISLMTLNALRAYLTSGNNAAMKSEDFSRKYTVADVKRLALNTKKGLRAEFSEDILPKTALNNVARLASIANIGEGPYFPLHRDGDYAVYASRIVGTHTFNSADEVNQFRRETLDRDPTLEVKSNGNDDGTFSVAVIEKDFRLSETRSEAKRNYDEMVRMYGKDAVSPPQLRAQIYSNMSTIAGEASLGTILNQLDDNEAAKAAIKNFYLRSLGEKSFRKHEAKRQRRRGVDPDIQHRAFASYATASSYYISQLRFGWKLARARADMEDAAEGRGVHVGQVVREIKLRDEMTVDPSQVSKWVRTGTSLSHFLLLTSPSYWMINATQPYMVTLPYLAARHGFGKTVAAMKNAQSLIASPLVKETISSLGGLKALTSKVAAEKAFSVLEQVEKHIRERAPDRAGDYIRMLDTLKLQNIIDLSLQTELREIATGTGSSLTARVLDASRLMAHLTEVNNRILTAITAYDLAIDGGAAHDSAVALTAQAVSRTQFNYSSGNKPRLFQAKGPLKDFGPLVFQFMQYPQHMYALMIGEMLKATRGNPAERRIAVKTLAGVFATHLVAGGLIGATLQPIKWAIGMLMAGLDDEDDRAQDVLSGEKFDQTLREAAAELFGDQAGLLLSKGLPAAMGADVSGRMSLGTLYFVDLKPENAESLLGSLMMSFGGPLPSLATGAWRGAGMMQEGEIQKGLEYFMPKALKDVSKFWRYGRDGLTSASGATLLGADKMSPLDLFLQANGLQPTRVSEAYEASNAINTRKQVDAERRAQLMRMFINADSPDRRQTVREKIMEFNRTAPSQPITVSSLMQSVARARERDAAIRRYGADLRGRQRRYAEEADPYMTE